MKPPILIRGQQSKANTLIYLRNNKRKQSKDQDYQTSLVSFHITVNSFGTGPRRQSH